MSVSQIAREAGLSRQGVYDLLAGRPSRSGVELAAFRDRDFVALLGRLSAGFAFQLPFVVSLASMPESALKDAANRVDFSGCIGRVDWASEALHALNDKSRRWFLEHDPAATTVEYHAEADVHLFRLEPEVPPLWFAVEASNIVHQLRACLDNLVWQLVFANRGKPRRGERGNNFPIIPVRKIHKAFVKHTQNSLRGVHPDHRTLIERLQPYKEPGWKWESTPGRSRHTFERGQASGTPASRA